MLDAKFIRENPEFVEQKLKQRGSAIDLENFFSLDSKRREIIQTIEKLRFEKNQASEKIAQMKRENKNIDSSGFRALKEITQKIKDLEGELKIINHQLKDTLLNIPNVPHESVPLGLSSKDNQEIRKWGIPPKFLFKPKAHWEIGENLKILDFQRAAKITGARFSLYKGAGALLERALINFMLDLHTKAHHYVEVLPPFIVNRQTMTGTGQLPKFEEDLFKLEGMDYFLIPTAEVPVTCIHQNEILEEEDLPLLYTAYTPCFRKEAGSYGQDTRGLIRQHQFNKVELVKFTTPENSYPELETLLKNAEEVLKRLEVHYKVVSLCTVDLGFSAAKTYDIEVWLPGQQLYREISSCSNFEDFQAQRASIKYRKKENKKTEFVHTLNGSGLAVGRTVVAILENYQQEDGSVIIPEVLRSYMGGLEKIVVIKNQPKFV
jgi:seryl-tRNA synthetase